MMDTVHRGGVAFITALGISTAGKKMVLGYGEGATENDDICKELLGDLERRGLKLSSRVIFVTDGGKGAIKALRDKFGKQIMEINVSAARSLREALPELLTLHRLNVPEELYKVLHTTNRIENLFSSVRHREHTIKNYNPNYRAKNRKGKLSQRWLVAVFLKAEENFRTVKGL